MNNSSRKRIEAVGACSAGKKWTEDSNHEPERKTPENNLDDIKVPDPEVREKTVKRKFSVEYKARIVREADVCTEIGQIGALLRREGLYSSQLAQWRRAYKQGALAALRGDMRRRKQIKHPLEIENEKLRKANVRLEKSLKQAEAIIDIQKKLSGLLGIPLESEKSEDKD